MQTRQSEAFLVLAINAHWTSREMAPLVLNLCILLRSVVNLTTGLFTSESRITSTQWTEPGWVPEALRTFWRKEKWFALARYRNPDHPSLSLEVIIKHCVWHLLWWQW